MKNFNLLSYILGFMTLMLFSATSLKAGFVTNTPAPPKAYHVKSFSSWDTRYDVEKHIISFYRKGYVLKSNAMFGGKNDFAGAIVVMEKY